MIVERPNSDWPPPHTPARGHEQNFKKIWKCSNFKKLDKNLWWLCHERRWIASTETSPSSVSNWWRLTARGATFPSSMARPSTRSARPLRRKCGQVSALAAVGAAVQSALHMRTCVSACIKTCLHADKFGAGESLIINANHSNHGRSQGRGLRVRFDSRPSETRASSLEIRYV